MLSDLRLYFVSVLQNIYLTKLYIFPFQFQLLLTNITLVFIHTHHSGLSNANQQMPP